MTSCKRGRQGRQSCDQKWWGLHLPDTLEKIRSLYMIMGFALNLERHQNYIRSWSSWDCRLVFIKIKFQVTDKPWIVFILVDVLTQDLIRLGRTLFPKSALAGGSACLEGSGLPWGWTIGGWGDFLHYDFFMQLAGFVWSTRVLESKTGNGFGQDHELYR